MGVMQEWTRDHVASHEARMRVLEAPFSLSSPSVQGWMPLPAANHPLTQDEWTQSALPLLILRRVYFQTL